MKTKAILNRSLSIAVTVVAATLTGPPAHASRAPLVSVQCGAEITADTVLAADVIGCAGDGLVIRADDVTLNLNGHSVSGDAVAGTADFDVGIRVEGHRGVTITNGSVQRFDRGVLFNDSSDGLISTLLVHDNSDRGIMLDNASDHGRVQSNVVTDNGASAIAVVSSNGAVITGNRSLRNPGGAGVRLVTASGATVAGNTLNGNDQGVALDEGSNDNRVSDNNMANDFFLGVGVSFSNGNVVTRNRIMHSGSGVSLESADNTVITDNQILHSLPPDGIGIQIYGNNNLAARNTVIDSVLFGIEVSDFQDPGHSPATGNVVRDNIVKGAGVGIGIGTVTAGVVLDTVIEGNIVSGAVGDGIQVVGPSTGLETSSVTANLAVHNGNFGIEAVAGTNDGGGNRAAANGNTLQCLNIVCRSNNGNQ